MKKTFRFALAVMLFITSNSLQSQEYFFRSYSIEQGLPQSEIYCALEDSRGEMWFGTAGSGLCRFNGIDTEVIDRSHGLSGNTIRSIFEDSKGNIWIGTENSLDKYDGYTIQSFTETKISETAILAINEDKKGNIWIGTELKGLFRIEYGDSLMIENFTVSEGLSGMFIFDIDIDNSDRIWISLWGGINIIEYEPGNTQITSLIEGYDIPSGVVLCGSMDSGGNMWFGTLQEGVFKVELQEDLEELKSTRIEFLDFLSEERIWDIKWTESNICYVATEEQGVISFTEDQLIDRFNKDNGIKTNQVYRITESSNGELWFSTLGKGMLKYEGKLLVKYDEGVGINGNRIFEVEISENGDLLVGSDEGFSVYQMEGDKLLELAHYTTADGLPSNDITSISYLDDEIWLGSSNGLARIVNGRISIPDFNDGLSSNKVNCLLHDSDGNLWIGTNIGYNLYMDKNLYRITEDEGFLDNEVQTIIEDKNGEIWIGTLGGLDHPRGESHTTYDKEDGLQELSIHAIAEDKNGDLWLGTFGGGIFLFSHNYDSIPISLAAGNDVLSSTNIYALEFLNDSTLLAATESGFDMISLDANNTVLSVVHYDVNDGYPGGGNNLNALAIEDELAWFGNSEGLVRLDPSQLSDLEPPQLQINRLKLFFEEQDWKTYGPTAAWFNLPHNLMLPYNDNHLTIGYSSIFYGNHSTVSYSYYLEGQSKDWSPYLQSREVDFPGLRPGKYTFLVKAKNQHGIIGETGSFAFEIKPPFWLRAWFIILVILILIAAVILYVRRRTRKLQLETIRLEKIVAERTQEVVEQKEEIEKQHVIVVRQNDEIEASIHYAERIQKAVVPSEDILKRNFEDSFILWRPQHIVSGDFYWVGEKGDSIVFTAADCTGHGVPGAFMSMLGVSYLNQIILAEDNTDPGVILCRLRDHIIASFSQKEQDEGERKDGMDIALCSFNRKTKKLYYAGAYNPLYLVRNTQEGPKVIEYKADKMPVGLYAIMDDFKSVEVDFKEGDVLYMFSDGFPDQFGGEKFKKFMKKRFREMLLDNQDKTLPKQKDAFNATLEDWMSFKDPDGEVIIQTDDVIVMGVKL